MGNTNLLSTRTWERCGRLSKDVAQRFLVLEAEVRSPNTSSFHALLNLPFVAAGQQWQRTEAKKAGNLRFQVKLFVLLWDLASHWVSKCVASFIVAAEEKEERESCHQLGVTTQRMAGHEGAVALFPCRVMKMQVGGVGERLKPSHLSLVYC